MFCFVFFFLFFLTAKDLRADVKDSVPERIWNVTVKGITNTVLRQKDAAYIGGEADFLFKEGRKDIPNLKVP